MSGCMSNRDHLVDGLHSIRKNCGTLGSGSRIRIWKLMVWRARAVKPSVSNVHGRDVPAPVPKMLRISVFWSPQRPVCAISRRH